MAEIVLVHGIDLVRTLCRGSYSVHQASGDATCEETRMSESDHLSKASANIQSIYHRYKQAVMQFGSYVSIHPTEKKYIGFRVNARRMANFHIGKQSFKIWLNVKPGTLNDPRKLTRQTEAGHTIRIEDDRNFEYVVNLLRQAHTKNK
jgi:predicted transport protein